MSSVLFQTTQLKDLNEISMYRQGLFAARCDLFAYRYKDTEREYIHFETGLVLKNRFF